MYTTIHNIQIKIQFKYLVDEIYPDLFTSLSWSFSLNFFSTITITTDLFSPSALWINVGGLLLNIY